MLRVFSLRLGGAAGRKAVVAGTGARRGRPRRSDSGPRTSSKAGRSSPTAAKAKASGTASATASAATARGSSPKEEAGAAKRSGSASGSLARPAYMSEAREKEVLRLAERMQSRDLSGDVPVASFAYEIIQKHPSVRTMGLRERMDFLCTRWSKLPEKKRLEYLNDPLKGLL